MDREIYAEHCWEIIELVEGMTDSQWNGVRNLIDGVFAKKKVKVTFEKPEHLDLLLRQNFIL